MKTLAKKVNIARFIKSRQHVIGVYVARGLACKQYNQLSAIGPSSAGNISSCTSTPFACQENHYLETRRKNTHCQVNY